MEQKQSVVFVLHKQARKHTRTSNPMELVIDHMLVLNGVEQSVGCHVTIETMKNIGFSDSNRFGLHLSVDVLIDTFFVKFHGN